MIKTIHICDACGKEDIFVSRPIHTPGQWTLFGTGTSSHGVHACSKECAVVIDADQHKREDAHLASQGAGPRAAAGKDKDDVKP